MLIRQGDDYTFAQELVDCDGSSQTVIDAETCTVQISNLIVTPFDLEWGQGVYASVTAHNAYGVSETSHIGSGVIILTIPDSPLEFVEDPIVRTKSTIGLTWQKGVKNGGTDVIDYRINYDQGTGEFTDLVSAVTDSSYVATGLTAGLEY